MPKIKITFHEEDPLFNIKLDTILNQTENDKERFASVYRDPDFINRMMVETDYDVTSLISLLVATASLIGIIYLFIKLRKLSLAMIILKTQIVTTTRALDILQLTQRPKTTEVPPPNMHETIMDISSNYWFYLIAILLLLAVARKTGKIIWNRCMAGLPKEITESSIILYMSNGKENVYLKIQDTNGRPQNLTIRSATYLSDAQITGFLIPKLKFKWDASIFNSMNQHTTQIKEIIRLSHYEAYRTRKVVSQPFHCHLLLFQDNRLDVIARVNEEILPAYQKIKTIPLPLGYDIVSMPSNKLYPTAPLL